nr:pitrilysin family protein [Neosynechococcus sphagnicola]
MIPVVPMHQNRRSRPRLVGLVLAFLGLFASWLLASGQPAIATTAKHYTDLIFPTLPTVQIPRYSRWQLANGITVYLIEDHELPLVNGLALFQVGDRLEPADQVGLAALTSQVIRSGGTLHHPVERLNQQLEERAAAVETLMGNSAGGASFTSLSEDLTTVFGLFAEVIREPAFDPAQIQLAKTQLRGRIARRNDTPEAIAQREFQKLIYGATSPYGRTIEYRTLDAIDRPDLVQFHQRYFQPQTMILGIVGDFDSKALRSLITQKLGDWQPHLPLPPAQLPADLTTVSPAHPGGLFLVNQPQLTQSYVQMGHLGGQFDSPDYPALDVMNQVLNDMGGGYLMN